MNEKIYLHAIGPNDKQYRTYLALKYLKQILKSKALLSRRLQQKELTHGFNGLDYISLCDFEKRFLAPKENYNSYEGYIRESLSLIFPKDKFDVIIPTVIDISTADKKGFERMKLLGESKVARYTDLPDEVQVKDRISLEYLSGITVPIHIIDNPLYGEKLAVKKVISEIQKIRRTLDLYGYNIPIYDIDSLYNIDEEENVKKIIKKYRNN